MLVSTGKFTGRSPKDKHIVRTPEVAEHIWWDQNAEMSPEGFDALIARNEDAQRTSGHWGTPLLVFDGEPFFGQDRVAMCRWRMQERGVLPRASR